ncbi:hypothetical protein GYMLUDRAFT_470727 [Collybiopsis luxurians FD-317 M1]|uniref:Unplaced genomic scaffold GYMLUscaffold_167, whole genome shotgun sequence n=1 Tax=Collybiopsis luxurians FD-317 M1 TaxID=944289 RepID=A0A0D0AJ92_9AGAR|nr:hypothetical protein GYMLUDRAFT_470727 [Collybiopsis luxurians FD-317 M1]
MFLLGKTYSVKPNQSPLISLTLYLKSSKVQDVYSTAFTHYPKWRWKTKRSEHFPLPSMEWYWHPEPPTLATVFSAPDSGHSTYRKIGILMLSQRTHDNVLRSHSTFQSSVKLIVQIQGMPIYGQGSKNDSAKLA